MLADVYQSTKKRMVRVLSATYYLQNDHPVAYQSRDSSMRNVKIRRLFICIETRYRGTSQNL